MIDVEVTVTVAGKTYEATVDGGVSRSDGAPQVRINRITRGRRESVGAGWWDDGAIEDCDADIDERVFRELDLAIQNALAEIEVAS